MENAFLALTLSVFVCSLVYIALSRVSLANYESSRVQARIESLLGKEKSIEKNNSFSAIFSLNKILQRQSFSKTLLLMLAFSGWNIPVSTFILGSMFFATLTFVLAFLITAKPANAALVSLAVAVIPYWLLVYRKDQYIKKFTINFPEALLLIKNSLRSGHSIQSAFQIVSQEARYPVNKEFALVVREIELGTLIRDALEELYRRIRTVDLKVFILGLHIQQEVGGNLVELMQHIETTIRDRLKLFQEVRAMSSQGRISGIVLMVMPCALAFILWVMNHGYFIPLFENEMGRKLLYAAGFLQLAGILAIRKITNFKVVN